MVRLNVCYHVESIGGVKNDCSNGRSAEISRSCARRIGCYVEVDTFKHDLTCNESYLIS